MQRHLFCLDNRRMGFNCRQSLLDLGSLTRNSHCTSNPCCEDYLRYRLWLLKKDRSEADVWGCEYPQGEEFLPRIGN